MLDLQSAEKSMSLLASQIIGKDIQLTLNNTYNTLKASSHDISHLLGINIFNSIKLVSSELNVAKEKESYYFRLDFHFTYADGSFNTANSFEVELNTDGSILSVTLAKNKTKRLTTSDPQFRKLMTTKDMVNDFFRILESNREDFKDQLESLIDKNYFIDSRNSKGDTPLHFTIEKYFDVDFIKWLVSKGADINAKNDNEETPLYTALTKRREDVIEFLIDNGANIIVTGNNENAVDVIKQIHDSNPTNLSNTEPCKRIESLIVQKMLEKNIRVQPATESLSF